MIMAYAPPGNSRERGLQQTYIHGLTFGAEAHVVNTHVTVLTYGQILNMCVNPNATDSLRRQHRSWSKRLSHLKKKKVMTWWVPSIQLYLYVLANVDSHLTYAVYLWFCT